MAERLLRERLVVGPVGVPANLVFARADLEIYGINTFRPSFVGHVFFNDAAVDTDVLDAPDATQRDSYAGRFALFGHQRCVGDEGHCEQPTARRRFDDRPSHPLTRAFRRVLVTDALRRIVTSGQDLTVTILVIASADDDIEYEGPLLDINGLQIATFEEP
jgi:hypothetical protein